MRIIYDGDKHRSLWGLACGMAFGVVFAVFAVKPLFDGGEIKVSWIAFAGLSGVAGLWFSWSTLHAHLTLPIDVSVLDDDSIQVRPRSGEHISLAATQFKRILYLYKGSKGTLVVKAGTYSWSLPVSEREAEEFIGTLLSLNPAIRVERKEDSSAE
jgi:hypothetical protein